MNPALDEPAKVADGGPPGPKVPRAVRHFRSFIRSAAAFALTAGALAGPVEWGQWRGDGTGVSTVRNLATEWSATKNVCWSVPVPGYGWSCPVVADGKIFLTTAITERQQAPLRQGPGGGEPAPDAVFRWEVHCLDGATGRTLWKQVAAEHKPAIGTHLSNTYASETPVTDGERIYAYFGAAGVFAYDLAGKLVWSKNLGAHRTFSNWGSSSSPVLDGERLFVLCDNEEQSFLVALDRKSGRELWRERRDEKSTWATPVVWRNSHRTEIVAMGVGYIRSYDPGTGRELWRLASERQLARPGATVDTLRETSPRAGGDGSAVGGPERGGAGGRGKLSSGGCKSTPVANREMIFVGCAPKFPGYELGPMWAVKAGASGNISVKAGEATSAGVAWYRYGAGPHFSSALLHEGRLYVFPAHERGVLSCFDAATGATVYEGELPGNAGFKASPWLAAGRIFCTDQRGATFIVEEGSHFQLFGKNALGELTWASPALAEEAMYQRTVERLYCIGPGSRVP